jgi:serine/threonine protein kinase
MQNSGSVPERHDLLAAELGEHYLIEEELGRGGSATVYLAQDLRHGRRVALKVLHSALGAALGVERFQREIRTHARLQHPHILPLYDSGSAAGRLYYTMPYVEAGSLRDRLRRLERLQPAAAVQLALEVSSALAYAHRLGIIHRDLKPENIMLVPIPGTKPGSMQQFNAVVMDFGLAKERRAGAELAKLTATGIVLGTPEFMSPEQIRGKPLDGRSDVYALGILAFELFTGQLPFPGKSAQETMIARLRGQPIKLRQLKADFPARVEAVISQALSMDPAQRFASMTEMAHALEAAHAPSLLGRIFGRQA